MESKERDRLIELEATKPECCSNRCNDVFEYREIDHSWICLDCKEIIPIEEPKTQAHTEGVWKVEKIINKIDYHHSEPVYWISTDSNGFESESVCDLYARERVEDKLKLTGFPNAKEHAHQIVNNHNNHQELVEALRGCIFILEGIKNNERGWQLGLDSFTLQPAKQALKNTEEGE